MKVILIMLGIVFQAPSMAALITFDFREPVIESLDGAASLILSKQGIDATVVANVGVLNRTSKGFGIDIVGNRCDNSDAIDRSCAGGMSEMISVFFSQPVYLVASRISGLSGGDIARWTLPDLSVFEFNTDAEHYLPARFFVEAGASFSWLSAADNTTSTQRGFSFDSVSVESANRPVLTKINEPAYLSFIALLLFLLTLIGRNDRRTSRPNRLHL